MTLLDYLKSKNIKINENWRYKGDESRMHDIVDNSLFFMDTISTHPEINVRIDQLKRLKEYNSLKTLEKDSIQYAELRINSIIQIILSTYINDNPAETLCYALMLKELDYEQEFSDNMIIISLCKGLFLKQKLQLNYSIGSTDSSYSLLLNQSIHFMQKIRQNEFNDVVCNLMESVKSKSEAEIYSFTAILYSAYFCFSKNKYNYLLHDYKVLNKNGFFKNDLIHLPKKK